MSVGTDGAGEAITALQEREKTRAAWLEGPEATEERLSSRSAFVDYTAAAAADLLEATFAEELAILDSDPARYLSDVSLVAPAGETAATIRDDGMGSLLEAGMPVRTQTDGGQLRKVDLSLLPTSGGYETENALSDVHIPNQANEPIILGGGAIEIGVPAAREGVTAERFGDKAIHYSEALPDTDLLVAPIGDGIELFEQLRSPSSPETLRFALELDPGAQLTLNSAGGADVMIENEIVAYVSPPFAVDAQGTRVPLELRIDGHAVVLQVPHRDRDFAYPILVDPAIHENYEGSWYWGSNLAALNTPGVWQYETNDPTMNWILGGTSCLTGDLCSPSTRGLFVTSVNGNLPAGLYGEWKYWVPGGTTYIPSIYPEPSAAINPFWRTNHGCSQSTYPHPYDYNGMFNSAANWPWWEKDRAQWYGHAVMYSQAKGVGFGLNTGTGGHVPCYRSIMAGGVAVRLDDPEAPNLNAPTGVPSGWLKAGQTVSVSASAFDPGLGVQNFHVSPEGALPFPYTPEQNQCPGTKVSPCPANATANFNSPVTLFSQGISTVQLSANDPTGEKSNTQSWQLKVDRTPPTIDLNGQLAVATDEDFIAGSPKEEEEKDPKKWDELQLPVYNLTITAKDGSTSTNLAKRSGVKDIEIWLDGQEQSVAWSPQECPATSCEMTKSYEVDLVDDLASGKHTLKVVAVDQLDQKEERSIEFEYVPATGISDDDLLQRFPLPDGKDHQDEMTYSGPELAVNLINGNLVYHEQDVDVEGSVADLEVERFYNSQLPANENTEWGDGWTLAQAPKIDPEPAEGPPSEAVVRSSTAELVRKVALPTTNGTTKFNPKLGAAVSKQAGAYVIEDESDAANEAAIFSESGRLEEVEVGSYASIDYTYDGGDLQEIAVDDPASSELLPDEVEGDEEDFTPAYGASFGSFGTANGQFKHPGGMDVAPDGTLWVADTENHRIQHFEADGDYLGKFGSLGTGDGKFNRPVDVEVDASGAIFVADAGNNRIQTFTATGAYKAKFGSLGSGNGQFNSPEGIAVDGSGNIWVADTDNNRLQKFTPNGLFLKSIKYLDTNEDHLDEPMGIDAGPGGNIFVADWENNRVAVFDQQGGYLRQFGIEGGGDGEFEGPVAINVDSNGFLWVSDESNERIEQFDQSGNYISQFGGEGEGDGEFEFEDPMGIATDLIGNIFIADSVNDRVQRWRIGGPSLPPATYTSTFGSFGSANGQFKHPAGVALAPDGTLWVADTENHRLQHFEADGDYLGKVGSFGTGNGQFNRPVDIAINSSGNIFVADAGNHRVQRFNATGAFVSKFGTFGTGNGQFDSPEGIAIGNGGNVWVADTDNNRLQVLTITGFFIKAVGTGGGGQGQFEEPMGIDIGPGGGVFVADWDNHRVVVYSEAGAFVRQFGLEGHGEGQFENPVAIEVDSNGYVWVADERNERIEQFDQGGHFLSQFGGEGEDEGELELANPMGMVSDAEGNMFVADSVNNRLQKWEIPDPPPPSEPTPVEDDPAVEIETPSGLVSSVEGEEAGEHSYDHSADDLVAYDGPEGETKYEYDGAGQMTKVTLPNGTVGTVAYRSDKRVKSVTVDPAGGDPAKTTSFEYSDVPRRTVVLPPDAPAMTYEIGNWLGDDNVAGIFRWSNISSGPKLVDIAGTLFGFKETTAPISIGDHNLEVEARSPEGIAEVQFIANGNLLVDEKTCEQNLEIPGTECEEVFNEWVVNTADLAPGIMTLEVLAVDEKGKTESARFWVNIPYTPPPPPDAVAPPKYADILEFRERHGLDVDLDPVQDESQLNDRIFNSIGAWHNPQTPDGAVARAAQERWGVPLRPVDVAELEWRLQYWEQASSVIPSWVAANASSTFAGFYLDEEAGGKIVVGFTGGAPAQAATVQALMNSGTLIAPDRIIAHPLGPSHALSQLEALEGTIRALLGDHPPMTRVSTDVVANRVKVGSSDVSATTSYLTSQLGSQPYSIDYEPEAISQDAAGEGSPPPVPRGREHVEGSVRGGDFITNPFFGENGCTAGYGGWESDEKPTTGAIVHRLFLIDVAHCFFPFDLVERRNHPPDGSGTLVKRVIGTTRRTAYEYDGLPGHNAAGYNSDVAAIRVQHPWLAPRQIFGEGTVFDVRAAVRSPEIGTRVCLSGQRSNKVICGAIRRKPEVITFRFDPPEFIGVPPQKFWAVCFLASSRVGDSGGPVWIEGTHKAIGLVSAGNKSETCFSPLKPLPGIQGAPGALAAPGIGNLHIMTRG